MDNGAEYEIIDFIEEQADEQGVYISVKQVKQLTSGSYSLHFTATPGTDFDAIALAVEDEFGYKVEVTEYRASDAATFFIYVF